MSQKSKMHHAHLAPRCQLRRPDGSCCLSPALKGKRFCYFHSRIRYPRRRNLLPRLEDGNSVQVALLSVARALREGTVDPASARLMLWALQMASANLKNVTFEPLAVAPPRPSEVE